MPHQHHHHHHEENPRRREYHGHPVLVYTKVCAGDPGAELIVWADGPHEGMMIDSFPYEGAPRRRTDRVFA